MFNIDFYEDYKGCSDVKDFLDSLFEIAKENKDARIQFKQMVRNIELLRNHGYNLPNEIIKHVEREIWELRPGKNRVFYFLYEENTYVLLHHFRKKTRKTPRREIDRAFLEMEDYIRQRRVKDT